MKDMILFCMCNVFASIIGFGIGYTIANVCRKRKDGDDD